MRTTNFFNTFKVVILACGPYSKAIKADKILEKDLFGDALIIYCHQLSYWDKSLNEKIAEIGKNYIARNRRFCLIIQLHKLIRIPHGSKTK